MIGQSWQIGRIFGIPLKVHISWFVVFAWITYGLAENYFPFVQPELSGAPWEYWLMGIGAALLLFASVLVHELGHSWVALRYHIPIAQITLFIFGGMAQIRREAPTPRAEFWIAIAGPIVSLLVAMGFYALGGFSETRPNILAVATLLQQWNIIIALFNLVPGYPLDGGRVLRAGIWAWTGNFHRATRYASRAGQGVAILLIGTGVYQSMGSAVDGVWLLLIGAFLYFAANNSHRQAAFQERLAGLRLSDIMTADVVTLEGTETVDKVVNQYSRYGFEGFPVVDNGQLIGTVSLKNLTAVPQTNWDRTTVSQVMVPRDPQLTMQSKEPVTTAIEQLFQGDRGRLIVTDGEKIVGILTRNGLGRVIDGLR
jgi:Zn-dependent protease/CBS domain-containing protein